MEWNKLEPDEKDEFPTVECDACGKELVAQTEMSDGDEAWYIEGRWYCDECAHDFFWKVVTL